MAPGKTPLVLASGFLYHNGITVRIVRSPTDPHLVVEIGEPRAVVAEFPTDTSLLRGVLNGYSYQVAASQGSLTISAGVESINIRFERAGADTFRCQVPRREYEDSLDRLASSDV